MSNATETPPPFQAHVTELESVDDGKITNVAVYSGRAEVTRLFRFALKAGQNQVHINGLPDVLEQDSLRVEGRGAGIIQEVSMSWIHAPPSSEDSARVLELLSEKEDLEQSAYRAKRALKSLDQYLESLTSSSTQPANLMAVIAEYNTGAKFCQEEIRSARDKLKKVEETVNEERLKLNGKKRHQSLNMKASIGIFAEDAGEVELGLVYAVMSATWEPKYDIRVDTQTKDKSVTLIYKGSLTQSSGEDWTDVPLVLETATPTFNKDIPKLHPWTISARPPPPPPSFNALRASAPAPPARTGSAAPQMAMAMRESYRAPPPPPMPEMSVRGAEVAKGGGGNVSATFSVPGKMSIPSDGSSHNVTIVQLKLDAKMTWVSVPRKDTKVHLSAKIKNSSDFLLLSGNASVYVDGSFISRSSVPSVSPDESFDCPLGLDPAIKVTYHPRTKKASQSGLINKTDVYLYTQRITVHNTKNIDVSNVKLLDHIPISEDANVHVKLISPALQLPGSTDGGSIRSSKGFSLTSKSGDNSSSTSSATKKIPAPVKVSNEVVAKWDDGNEEEENIDVGSLGKDGKVNFVCALPAQGKTNISMQWEVTAPAKTKIYGL
ncbi:mucoidy inhibitor A [Coprinopsis sp. MPI-PUGE-AT-0042]|nr:mucoidy inhibitor A [Coprinopsis sp. MPI-PUGE-AT-0042]